MQVCYLSNGRCIDSQTHLSVCFDLDASSLINISFVLQLLQLIQEHGKKTLTLFLHV